MSGTVVFRDPRTCAVCETPFLRGDAPFSHVVTIPRQLATFGEFDIWRCETCGVGLTAPQPTIETTPLLYAEQDSADFDVVGHTIVDRIKDALALRGARALVRGRRIETVLDFGAGNGRFANALKRAVPRARVVAVDFSERPPDAERSYFGASFEYLSYAEFERTDIHFDLILCRHVLEHTHDPRAFVRELYDRLVPGGLLELEVPNLDSALAKLTGPFNPGYYVPRHLLHFTRRSMPSVAPAGAFVEIGSRSMPLMGNLLADASGRPRNTLAFQLAGIPLYAVQWLLDKLFATSTCLTARIERPICSPQVNK